MPAIPPLHLLDFTKGYSSEVPSEVLPDGFASRLRDMEITRNGRLIRAPGTTSIETLSRIPERAVLHAGFAKASELVFVDPPYVGIKYSGATTWYDVGIPQADYAFANYGGVLLMSGGVGGLYSRLPRQAGVTLVAGAQPAKTIALFAARVVLGGTYIGGVFEPMGLAWSDAESDFTGWNTGAGAGFEILISDQQYSDRIVALRPLGFDTLAILTRRSLWIGRPTGDRDRPIDPKPRLEGVGCVVETAVASTEFGVVLLSDDGVRLFDLNGAQVISEQINADILPIDESQLGMYRIGYNPASKRLYLHTPTNIWVMDLLKRRWYQWSTRHDMSVVFPVQTAPPTWDSMVGLTWDQVAGAWDDQLGSERGMPSYFVTGTELVKEDSAATQALGVLLLPNYQSPIRLLDQAQGLLQAQKVELIHEAVGTVTIQLPGINGQFEDVRTVVLGAGPHSRIPIFSHTGIGLGLGVRYEAGSDPRVRRAVVYAAPAGEAL
jgi:hypothetical protein